MKTDGELTEAYHNATSDYESVKAGGGDHLGAFTKLLVAERVLTARLGYGFDQNLKYFREHYSL